MCMLLLQVKDNLVDCCHSFLPPAGSASRGHGRTKAAVHYRIRPATYNHTRFAMMAQPRPRPSMLVQTPVSVQFSNRVDAGRCQKGVLPATQARLALTFAPKRQPTNIIDNALQDLSATVRCKMQLVMLQPEIGSSQATASTAHNRVNKFCLRSSVNLPCTISAPCCRCPLHPRLNCTPPPEPQLFGQLQHRNHTLHLTKGCCSRFSHSTFIMRRRHCKLTQLQCLECR